MLRTFAFEGPEGTVSSSLFSSISCKGAAIFNEDPSLTERKSLFGEGPDRWICRDGFLGDGVIVRRSIVGIARSCAIVGVASALSIGDFEIDAFGVPTSAMFVSRWNGEERISLLGFEPLALMKKLWRVACLPPLPSSFSRFAVASLCSGV